MIQCVWRQSLRFGNRIHRLKPTECCNTVCCPTKTNRQQSFSVVQLQECKHAMSSSPGNGSPFTKHQRSGRIYARPRCTGSRKCISSALLDELAAFPRDDEWSGRSLSPQLGKARGGKHRYLGIFSRAGSPIFQRPITAKSQQQGGP